MRRLRHVAVILDASRSYYRKVMRGVVDYRRATDHWDLYIEEEPKQRWPDLRSWDGDGLVVNLDDPQVTRAIRKLTIPVVGYGSGYGWYSNDPGIPYFKPDHPAIARLAAQHLLERGFRRFAFCGVRSIPTNGWSRIRGETFSQCIADAGFPCAVLESRYSTARSWPAVRDELSVWLRSLEKPVGLMAANDVRARHVLEVCRHMGIRIPDDVAVIGVNNDDTCELRTPPLTSVEQNAHRLGYEAAALLDRLMDGEKPRQTQFVIPPIGVVSRLSTDIMAVDNLPVAEAVRFIREHCHEQIAVDDIVSRSGVSRSTLEAKFKSTLGRTIHSEIQRVQIERIRHLLTATDLPIKTIARQTGFRSVQYLTTVFHNQSGYTPADYRSRSRS